MMGFIGWMGLGRGMGQWADPASMNYFLGSCGGECLLGALPLYFCWSR